MNVFKTPSPLWSPPDDPAPVVDPAAAPVVDPAAPVDKNAPAPSFLAGAEDPALDKPAGAAPAEWPDDWRDKLAGDDKDFRKRLDRIGSMSDFSKSYREAEKKITSGKKSPALDEPMPDGATDPDGLKAWREARGVPDDPTGYTVPDTVKGMVTDEDKPLIASFTESMHAKGIPAAAVGPVLEWYFENQAASGDAVIAADKKAGEELQEELRSEWGSDFRPNSILAKKAGEAIFGDIPWTEARLPDGRRLGDIPGMTRSLAKAARAEFGDVAFAGDEASAKTLGRKAEIEQIRRDDFDKYDNDKALKAEYQSIVEAELKRSSRS